MNNERIHILADMPIGKALYKLAAPATVAMMVNSLYNIIDTIFVGRYVGSLGIAGLSIAFPLQIIAFGIASMFGMGGASIISRQLGNQQHEKANITLVSTFAFSLIVSILFAVFGSILIEPLLRAFGASDMIFPYAYSYMRIIIPGFLFFMNGVCLNNIIRAEGAAKISMNGILIGAGGNIILDYVFIVIFNMGIFGGALATVIAQFFSVVYLLSYYLLKKSIFKISLKYLYLKYSLLKDIVGIGSSAFIVQAGNSVLVLILNNSLGHYGGDIMISVYGVINKVNSFLILPMIGIRKGAQPIIGYSYGAKNLDRLNKALFFSLKIMVAYGLFSLLIMEIFAPQAFYLFASDASLVENGALPLRIFIAMVPLLPIALMTSTFFQSIGFAKEALITSMVKIIAVLPLVYLLANAFSTIGIFISLPLADFVTFVICYAMLRKILNQLEDDYQFVEGTNV